MIQDRLKIKKLRAGDLAPDVMLGRQTLLNCAAFKGWGQGCDGGEPLEVSESGRSGGVICRGGCRGLVFVVLRYLVSCWGARHCSTAPPSRAGGRAVTEVNPWR
jgi:hypothetical protein